jgi:O-antigen/teichoic acid export membrane protein
MIKILKNVLVVGFSNLVQAGSVFLKGVILARILGVHEFGFAIILLSVTGALDIFADAGIDRFVVQSRFGFRADVMATSHAFRLFGSLLVGAAIAVCAYPLALLFKSDRLFLPIASAGGVVAIRGLVNLRYKLQQRNHRFEQETIIDTVRFSADLAVASALAVTTHSFLAALGGSYANALVQLILSHSMVKGPYSFWPRQKLTKLVGRFSVPIYINATMLFAAMQGDRMVVAGVFSKSAVALYAVSGTLGQGLASVIGKIAERLLLPLLARRDTEQKKRRQQVSYLGYIFISGSFVFQILISVVGPTLIRKIYGHAYTGIDLLVWAAAIFQMIQIQQAWLNSTLMANGVTNIFPWITLARSAAFPVAITLALLGQPLVCIPISFAFGAALSLAISYRAAGRLGLIAPPLPVLSFSVITVSIVFVVFNSLFIRP